MHTCCIMVVDDDANIRELLDVHLRSCGYAVIAAENGKQGLALYMQHRPALIVLDIMMPEMDGWELCKMVRDDDGAEQVKILMLTARDTDKDRMIGKEILAADDYMTKPFEPDMLVAKVKELLGHA